MRYFYISIYYKNSISRPQVLDYVESLILICLGIINEIFLWFPFAFYFATLHLKKKNGRCNLCFTNTQKQNGSKLNLCRGYTYTNIRLLFVEILINI
jgi:hypothetical protein